MSYLVLARKCRPGRFDDVVGQKHVTRTLANAIRMDRVAHGFLFSGVRGVGKTSLARILAKSLNCAEGPTDVPCDKCESCRSIASGKAVDVIEIDGASNNSVDDIRELRETVPYRPVLGRYKIYVIDEVHMLSVSAFNALLKTLEEPPPHVKFIFATTEPHKIPMTILSRVQRYDFRRIPTAAIIERIALILKEEGIEAEDGALAIVGREAEGSMRDALSIMDQVLAAGEKRITAEQVAELLGVVARNVYYEISAALILGDPRKCLEVIRDVDRQGFDMTTFTRGLLEHLRNLIVTAVCNEDAGVLDLPEEEIEDLKAQARSTSSATLHRMFKHLSEAYEEIARSPFPRILLEATLARLADLGEMIPAARILQRLEALSGGSPGGGPGSGTPNPPVGPGNRTGSGVSTAGVHGPAGSAGSRAHLSELKSLPSTSPAPISKAAPIPDKSAAVTAVTPDSPIGGPSPVTAVSMPVVGQPKETTPLTETRWQELLGELSGVMPIQSSILERAILAQQSTTAKIVLQFDKSDEFAAGRARDREFQRDIEAFLSTKIGQPVRIAVETSDIGGLSSLAKAKLEDNERQRQLQEQALSHPVVKGIQAALGGKVEKVHLQNQEHLGS